MLCMSIDIISPISTKRVGNFKDGNIQPAIIIEAGVLYANKYAKQSLWNS